MLNEQVVHEMVQQVLKKIIEASGAPGRKGSLIAVFTGATVDLKIALGQVVKLLMNGYELEVICSDAGRLLFGDVLKKELKGLPGWEVMEPGRWLGELSRARAVIAPMLSVNTLSKLSGLLADDVPSNLLLHGLFMGKPVVLCTNGVDPDGPGRTHLGFTKGNAALTAALKERMAKAVEYGCVLTDVRRLSRQVSALLTPKDAPAQAVQTRAGTRYVIEIDKPVLSASDIRQAHSSGGSITVSRTAVITPLAKEAAARLGIDIIRRP